MNLSGTSLPVNKVSNNPNHELEMTTTLTPTAEDTIPKPILNKHLWKISADSTPDMQSISIGGEEAGRNFFSTGQLHPRPNSGPVTFEKFQPDWILGILLTASILLAWTQFFYPKRLRLILIAPYSKRYLNQLVREGKLFSERISVSLGIIYVLLFPLLIYQVYDLLAGEKYSGFLTGFSVYIVIIMLFLLFWTGKISLMKFLGIIFRTGPSTTEYLMNIMLFNFLMGILLIPLLVLVIYMKSVLFLQISLVIAALVILLTFSRGIIIGISLTKFSYVFLFVYLCSLEILPYLVLIKLFRLYF
jgi:hypothetical protein